MRLKLHSGGKQDFEDAVRHYVAVRPDLAARFIDEVNASFELIKQDPQRWRIVQGSIRRVHGSLWRKSTKASKAAPRRSNRDQTKFTCFAQSIINLRPSLVNTLGHYWVKLKDYLSYSALGLILTA